MFLLSPHTVCRVAASLSISLHLSLLPSFANLFPLRFSSKCLSCWERVICAFFHFPWILGPFIIANEDLHSNGLVGGERLEWWGLSGNVPGMTGKTGGGTVALVRLCPIPTLAFYLVSFLAAPGNCECRQPFPSARLPSGAKQDLLFFSGYCKYSLFIPHPVFFYFFF